MNKSTLCFDGVRRNLEKSFSELENMSEGQRNKYIRAQVYEDSLVADEELQSRTFGYAFKENNYAWSWSSDGLSIEEIKKTLRKIIDGEIILK